MNLRLLALAAVATCAVALPLAMASAGPAGDDRDAKAAPVPGLGAAEVPLDEGSRGDAGAPGEDAAAPDPAHLLGLGLATATRCGPEVTSPDGIEAQTCVLTQGEDTWARTYYRNATGDALDAVLSMMGPDGRTVQMRCAVGAEDGPASCETPRERTHGEPAAYWAITEFGARGGQGPSLLRSGSNSDAPTGS